MHPVQWFALQFGTMTSVAWLFLWLFRRSFAALFAPRALSLLRTAVFAGIAANFFRFILIWTLGREVILRSPAFAGFQFGIYLWHYALFFALLAWPLWAPFSGRVRKAKQPFSPERRRLLAALAAAPAAAPALAIPGGFMGSSRIAIREAEAFFPDLPEHLEGFTIAQITDTHLGPFLSLDHLESAARLADSLQPDLFVATGDLADDRLVFGDVARILSGVRARLGSFACPGNHEQYVGFREFQRAFAGSRVDLLLDERRSIETGRGPIELVGLDFPHVRQLRETERREANRRAFGREPGDPLAPRLSGEPFRLCLSHHPKTFPETAAHGADLTLSGHTHAFQMRILGFSPGHAFFRYVDGGYRLGNRQLFVSAGAGHWLPMRFDCPAEVARITLRKGPAAHRAWIRWPT